MNESIIGLTIVCIICYLLSRVFIALAIFSNSLKKERKSYKANTTLWERYWLVNTKKYFKPRYSKSEQRYIDYQMIISIYFYTHTVGFISLVITLLIDVLVSLNILNLIYAEVTITINLLVVLLSFAVFACVEYYVDRDYHKKRGQR